MTSAYKTMIEDDKDIWLVLKSGVFLEVSNGVEETAIYRSIKNDTRDSKLVTVYFSKLTDMYAEHTNIDEWIIELQMEHDSLKIIKPRVVDNYDELEEKLEEVEMILSENHDKERDLQAEIGVKKGNFRMEK